MVQTANEIFRDFETDGVPASGTHKPKKSEIRPLLTRLENIYDGALAGGALVYETKTDLTADTTQVDNAMAWVLGDDTVANNGIYQFDGTAWNRLGDLPYSYIKASNGGTGTANAIQATTSVPVPAADGGALIVLPIVANNTASPVTVAFNGGAALTVKGRDQEDVAAGDLVPGIVAGYKLGSAFQLITDVSSLRNYLAARDEADRATTQADRATSEAAASQTSAQQAQDLVTQATAGFTGFADGQAYDFGFVADPTTYFDQDWGTIA